MQAVKAGVVGKARLLTVLAVLAVGGVCVVAADPEKKDTPADKKDAASEKHVAFAMDGKPWDAVFKWLTDETGKVVFTTNKPTGTFSFVGPEKKTYTIPEVIDIINGGLLSNSQTQKYVLINGDNGFFVVPADEKIDPSFVPHLDGPEESRRARRDRNRADGTAADLAERGGHGDPDHAAHGTVPRDRVPCPAMSCTCRTRFAT